MASAHGITLVQADGTVTLCQHGEAFALMKYRNRATGRVEWLWNTRDGVTPFGLSDPTVDPAARDAWRDQSQKASAVKGYGAWIEANPDPSIMQHADWAEDAFAPNFVPPLGMRVFFSWGDAPEAVRAETAAAWAKRIAEAQPPEYRAKLAEQTPFGYTDDQPVVVVVDEAIQAIFAARASDNPFVPARSYARAR